MNAFLNTADHQLVAPVKRKHEAKERRAAQTAPMVPTPAEKQIRDQEKQVRVWKAWRRERRETLLTGPYAKEIGALQQLLVSLTPSSAGALVRYVAECKWLIDADRSTRIEVLCLVGSAIVRLREKLGLAPFDDSVPGEEPTAYEKIREILA